MLSELLKRKRELMGWTGLAAVAVGLLLGCGGSNFASS